MSAEANAWSHLKDFRWNLGRDDVTDVEAELMDLAVLRDQLDRMITLQAKKARLGEGISWTNIGKALGISRQAAAKRFGRPEFHVS